LARPVVSVRRSIWRDDGEVRSKRAIPEETAVRLHFQHGILCGDDGDAVGPRGLCRRIQPYRGCDLVEGCDRKRRDRRGRCRHRVRIWLEAPHAAEFLGRRRKMEGPTGCGLCGIESLVEAMRPPPKVHEGGIYTPNQIMKAIESLYPLQVLNQETRAVHAAGFWDPASGLVAVREDVGRHNALDKLAGALAHEDVMPRQGMIVLTSRVSVEMVQKSAAIGAPMIVAISAPTALAVRMADAAGMTLVAIARKDAFEVFTHPHRISGELTSHVA
jgi:FdhD protein